MTILFYFLRTGAQMSCWRFSVCSLLTSYKSLWISPTIIYLACYVIPFQKNFCYFSTVWCFILYFDDIPEGSTLIVLYKITVLVFSLVILTKLVSWCTQYYVCYAFLCDKDSKVLLYVFYYKINTLIMNYEIHTTWNLFPILVKTVLEFLDFLAFIKCKFI